jgi:hypothetical protein
MNPSEVPAALARVKSLRNLPVKLRTQRFYCAYIGDTPSA